MYRHQRDGYLWLLLGGGLALAFTIAFWIHDENRALTPPESGAKAASAPAVVSCERSVVEPEPAIGDLATVTDSPVQVSTTCYDLGLIDLERLRSESPAQAWVLSLLPTATARAMQARMSYPQARLFLYSSQDACQHYQSARDQYWRRVREMDPEQFTADHSLEDARLAFKRELELQYQSAVGER